MLEKWMEKGFTQKRECLYHIDGWYLLQPKLKSYAFSENTLKLMRSYLKDRR